MPQLTDTELRVLLVVLRQTVGREKPRDWIARSQMASLTGRSFDAVSRAIEGLVQRGMIVVEDAQGRLLLSPAARRTVQGRLYFRSCMTATFPSRVIHGHRGGVHYDTTRQDKDIYVVSQKTPRSEGREAVNSAGVDKYNLSAKPVHPVDCLTPQQRSRIEDAKSRIRGRLERLSNRSSEES
jgi:phage replication O-like protein O